VESLRLDESLPRGTLANVPACPVAGHLAVCALQHGQEHEVLVPGPHLQRDTCDQTTLQEAATYQVREKADHKTVKPS
jgi:hypothetical protein